MVDDALTLHHLTSPLASEVDISTLASETCLCRGIPIVPKSQRSVKFPHKGTVD